MIKKSSVTRFPMPFYWAILLLAICLFCYAPGLAPGGVGFFLDDYTNILKNTALHVETFDTEALIRIYESGKYAGPLKRPLSMLSFSLHYFFGLTEAWHFKLVNLFLHLLNGLLVAGLCTCLFGKRPAGGPIPVLSGWGLSCAVLWTSSLWLLCPVQINSVLYIVQRMNSLAAFFCLLGLCLYSFGRAQEQRALARGHVLADRRVLWGFLCVVPAALCKENGALLPLLLLLVEGFFFRFRGRTLALSTLYSLFLLLPYGGGLLLFLSDPSWLLGGYQQRDYGPWEQLLTQARVLTHYLYIVLIPDIGSLFLFQDNYPHSRGWTDPPTTLLALLFLGGLLLSALRCIRPYPLFSFGLLFFLIGHLLESTFLPLEPSFDHRNYLPGLGLFMIIGYGMGSLYARRGGQRKAFYLGILAVLLAGYSLGTWSLARKWGTPMYELSRFETMRLPHSARASYYAASSSLGLYQIIMEPATTKAQYLAMASQHVERTVALAPPGRIYGQVLRMQIQWAKNQPIPPSWIAQLSETLSEQKLHRRTPNSLGSLQHCGDGAAPQMNHCGLEQEQLETLLRAPLLNEQLSPNLRDRHLRRLALFLWEKQEIEKAISLVTSTLRQRPDSRRLRILLSEMRYAAGCPMQAVQQILREFEKDTSWIAPYRLEDQLKRMEQGDAFPLLTGDDDRLPLIRQALCTPTSSPVFSRVFSPKTPSPKDQASR